MDDLIRANEGRWRMLAPGTVLRSAVQPERLAKILRMLLQCSLASVWFGLTKIIELAQVIADGTDLKSQRPSRCYRHSADLRLQLGLRVARERFGVMGHIPRERTCREGKTGCDSEHAKAEAMAHRVLSK
jgi:hypothetical protein